MIIDEALEIVTAEQLLHLRVTGRLTKGSYERLAPIVDELVQAYGTLRILLEMHDFHGWTAGAVWEDFKFDFWHFQDIERVAVVGEKKWEEVMTNFFKPFTLGRMQYFDRSEIDEAKAWLVAS